MYLNEAARNAKRTVFILIAINIFLYLAITNPAIKDPLMLNPVLFKQGAYWQIITAMFIHGSFSHLAFNMFALFIFGGLTAPILGTRRFLLIYFAAGILGNALWLTSVWKTTIPLVVNGIALTPALIANHTPSLVGASGAIMGVIMAAAMTRPDIPMMLLFFPFPIKLRTLAIVFVSIDVLSQIAGNPLIGSGNVAYLAHIGGFLGGYLYMRLFLRKFVSWDPLSFSGRRSVPPPQAPPPSDWHYSTPSTSNPDSYRHPHNDDESGDSHDGKVTQRELDFLLTKLSRSGINSLTEDELARLRQAREQMRGPR